MGGASEECILSTGTDEHGLKIQQAARERGCPPRKLCDNISMVFKVTMHFFTIVDIIHFLGPL